MAKKTAIKIIKQDGESIWVLPKQYNRFESISMREEGVITRKLVLSRAKTDDTTFRDLYGLSEPCKIEIYADESDETPIDYVEDYYPTELSLASSPPNYSLQERLVFAPYYPGV